MTRQRRFFHHRFKRGDFDAFGIPERSAEPFSESLGRLIKASGVGQQNLASALKVSNTTIHNYIKGYRLNPERDFMLKIADYFDVKPTYFREYRTDILLDKLELHPDLIDVFLDLASRPAYILQEWKERNAPASSVKYEYRKAQ